MITIHRRKNDAFAKAAALQLLIAVLAATLLITAGCDDPLSETSSTESVLQYQLRSKVQVLDPAQIGDVMSDAVASEFFECLYGYHYLKRPYQIIPQIADGMPEVSDDKLTYTIRIKKGIFFADDKCFDGAKTRELKTEDFVFAWKRIADIKTLSKNWWILDDTIVGLDEFREYTKSCKSRRQVDYSRSVEGLLTPDDYTLVIRLKKPWPQIMYLLAFIPTAPIAKEAVEYYGKDIISHPVGTGPFKLKTWNRGSYIEAVRNQNYREEFYPSEGQRGDLEKGLLKDAGRRLPFVDRIIWNIVTEDQPRWLMFLKGKIDITSIPKDNFGQAISFGTELTEDMKQRNIHLVSFQEPDTFWVGMNLDDALFGSNKALRLAISCAFDRERWIELFFNGRGKVAHGFIPPNMPSYDPNIVKFSKTEYNPEKARALLRQAEQFYGDKIPTLRLTMSGTDTTYRQMGQFLHGSFQDIGMSRLNTWTGRPTWKSFIPNRCRCIRPGG